MLKLYVVTLGMLSDLRADKRGVVSLEYVIVAGCIVAAVAAAFGSTSSGGLGSALSTAVGKIITAVSATSP